MSVSFGKSDEIPRVESTFKVRVPLSGEFPDGEIVLSIVFPNKVGVLLDDDPIAIEFNGETLFTTAAEVFQFGEMVYQEFDDEPKQIGMMLSAVTPQSRRSARNVGQFKGGRKNSVDEGAFRQFLRLLTTDKYKTLYYMMVLFMMLKVGTGLYMFSKKAYDDMTNSMAAIILKQAHDTVQTANDLYCNNSSNLTMSRRLERTVSRFMFQKALGYELPRCGQIQDLQDRIAEKAILSFGKIFEVIIRFVSNQPATSVLVPLATRFLLLRPPPVRKKQ